MATTKAKAKETTALTGLRKDGTNPRALGTSPRQVAAKAAVAIKKTPQGRAETAAEKAANETTGGIVPIKKSALSLDLGPRIIHALYSYDRRIDELDQERHDLKVVKSKAQLSHLAMGIAKAAMADNSIDLSVAFSGDTKLMNKLNNQLGVALGFREVKLGEPDKSGVAYDVVVTAAAVGDVFPMPGERKKNPVEWQKKRTFETNFLSQLKKCIMSVHAVIETKSAMSFDEKAQTLMVSGPAIKKHFGQEKVLLDERKNVGVGDAAIELFDKPSFTSLANIGASLKGVEPAQPGAGGPQHRGKQPGTVGGTLAVQAVKAAEVTGKESTDQSIVTICKVLQKALENATSTLAKATVAALEEVMNAIDAKLASRP